MYKLNIKIPIYKCTIHVVIADDIEKVINRYAKKNKWDKSHMLKDGEEVHGYAVSSGNLTNYYVFYSLQSLTSNYISHEISHVIDYILEEKDIERMGEGRAYLTGYISENIFEYVIKKQLLISKWLKYVQQELQEQKELKENLKKQVQEKPVLNQSSD